MCSHSQRKQQKDLLAALQKVVVPIYCTSFLAVEEDKQQKITRVNIKHMDSFVSTWNLNRLQELLLLLAVQLWNTNQHLHN